MIFLGDFASANGYFPEILHYTKRQNVVLNLEGPICFKDMEKGLYSVPSVIDKFKEQNVTAVSISNNHTMDNEENFTKTLSVLERENIQYFGGGRNIIEAVRPAMLSENGIKVYLLGVGWKIISCKGATKNKAGVNLINENRLLQEIAKLKENEKKARIILCPHWNYELERFPQPMHRELALKAIDAGADLIVGTHPHCVGGIEIYKSKYIFYSIGNWWITRNYFYKGKLNYPGYSDLEFAVEYNPETADVLIHQLKLNLQTQTLNYISTAAKIDDGEIRRLSLFTGYNQKQYIEWFKKNRIKNKLLPVFVSESKKLENELKNVWIFIRVKILQFCYMFKKTKQSSLEKCKC
jgi:poly-gamma-glutamate synthesis protein (capsule biosynthesis protein)